MNANMKLWVGALRSGEFPQAQHRLRIGDSYCCLGVACEVYRRATGKGEWVAVHHDDGKFAFGAGGRKEVTLLPDEVVEWLGVDWPGPRVRNAAGVDIEATDMNDGGATFAEIADAIEAKYGKVAA